MCATHTRPISHGAATLLQLKSATVNVSPGPLSSDFVHPPARSFEIRWFDQKRLPFPPSAQPAKLGHPSGR